MSEDVIAITERASAPCQACRPLDQFFSRSSLAPFRDGMRFAIALAQEYCKLHRRDVLFPMHLLFAAKPRPAVLHRYVIPGGSASHFRRSGYTFDVGSSMMFGFGDKVGRSQGRLFLPGGMCCRCQQT